MYASKKTKITCCSELRKWSPKTPFSGGVSCWHLPYQKSMCPQRTLKCTVKAKITCCSELWSDRLNLRIREGHMLFWYGRSQQLTPPESRKRGVLEKKIKHISCVFLLLFFTFLTKCLEFQIFFRAFRLEVVLAKSSHSGGPLGRL